MLIKKTTLTYIFLTISLLFTFFTIYIIIRSTFTSNDIEKTGQTNTFERAKYQNIDLTINKGDFYTDNSELLLFNLTPNKFLIIYNKSQIKIFDRAEFASFSDDFLSKRLTPFAKLLWKYFEMSKIAKLNVLKMEKNMGKLIANNVDYTIDLVTYTNFCLRFVAEQTDVPQSG